MALKVDITDDKGVKTRYHRIEAFTYRDGKLKVSVRGYVNQTTRDAEKLAVESNQQALQYDMDTEDMRNQLDNLSAQLQPNGEGDPEVIAQIQELSAQVNERVSNQARPLYSQVVDKYYDESEVELDWFEPLTMESLYAALAQTERYLGAESI